MTVNFSRSTSAKVSVSGLLLIFACYSPRAVAEADINQLFSDAMEHVEAQRWQQAEALFERILQQNPNLHRARLELALVYVKENRHEAALAELVLLLSEQGIPETVRANIKTLIRQLDSLQVKSKSEVQSVDGAPSAHQWGGALRLGVGYDDNVRFSSGDYFFEDDPFYDGVFFDYQGQVVYAAPDGYIYNMDGEQITRNNGLIELPTTDKSTAFTEGKFNLNHKRGFGATQSSIWINDLDLQLKQNRQLSHFDSSQLRASSQLNWSITPVLSATFELEHRLLTRDGELRVRASRFESSLGYLSGAGKWSLGGEFTKRSYTDLETQGEQTSFVFYGYSSNTLGVFLTWSSLFFNGDLLLLGKAEYMDTQSSDYFDSSAQKISGAVAVNLTDSLSWTMSLSYYEQTYDIDNESDRPTDESRSLKSQLTWEADEQIDVFLAAERATRDSEFYGGIGSDKNTLQLGMKWKF